MSVGEQLTVEDVGLLDRHFSRLQDSIHWPCDGEGCPYNSDHALGRCRIILKRGLEEIAFGLFPTPRRVLEHNRGHPKQQIQVLIECASCGTQLRKVVAFRTKELLYTELRALVCHDKSLPILFDPEVVKVDIPDQAAHICYLAHKFPAEKLGRKEINAIANSLRDGILKETLDFKMHSKRLAGKDPKSTYVRIGVGIRSLGKITAVLELWPRGHTSPKHHHGGCAGSVRLVHGALDMQLFRCLEDEKPLTWMDGEAGLTLPPGEHTWMPLSSKQTTWMDRANWFVHIVHCPVDKHANVDGFALSLHTYKSCVEEWEVKDGLSATEFKPINDFFWNLDLPRADPRVDASVDFEQVFSEHPRPPADSEPSSKRPVRFEWALQQLVHAGIDETNARAALRAANGDPDQAMNFLLR